MPIFQLDSPAARQLADHASVLQDLRFVIEICRRLSQMMADDVDDSVALRALWSAALVAYIRCFSTGKRVGLDQDDVVALELDGATDFHAWIKALRDKHVVHSVNPFEQVQVGAVVTPEGAAEREVEGVATLSMSLVVTAQEGVDGLRQLAAALADRVAKLGQDQTDRVLVEAKTIPIETLEQRHRIRTTAPESDAARQSR